MAKTLSVVMVTTQAEVIKGLIKETRNPGTTQLWRREFSGGLVLAREVCKRASFQAMDRFHGGQWYSFEN